ncbi:MAG TPA: TM2 domain-containing protein [Marinilabiliaceae bacterium]|nr:TM2 domain-containing protein [Marinilabiliaceae bacterium]
MHNIFNQMPEAELQEIQFLDSLLKGQSDENIRNFINFYRTRRMNPQTLLLTALLGFVWISGVHRFLIGQIGMGLLYLFTGGLCLIGTIVDLVNHKNLAFEYNQKIALEIRSTLIN